MRNFVDLRVLALIGGLSACPPSGGTSTSSATEATSDSTASSSTTMSPATSTTPTTSTSPTSTSATTSTTEAEGCGNGVPEPGEVCDDGNQVQGDGCNNDCVKSGTLLWEYKSGIPGPDEVRDIAVDGDVGVVVVGGQNGDIWIAHFSEQLAADWSKLYDRAPSDKATSVALGADAIFATGGITPDVNIPIRKAWTARLTLQGEIEWEDAWVNDLGDAYSTQIALTESGDVVIAGMMSVSADGVGVFARGYSAAGEAQWTTNQPISLNNTSLYPLGPGLAISADALLVGFGYASGGLNEFVTAFPTTGGAPLWTKNISDNSGAVTSIVRTANDEFVAATVGDMFSAMTVRRLTGAADVIWSSDKCVGDTARAVALDPGGDIVAIGDGTGTIGANIRLCKFEPGGSLRWGLDIDGGIGDDRGYAVAVNSSGQIIAGGGFDTGGKELDAWLAVYSP